MRWRERDGVAWLEARLPAATAAFTARTGGTSEGPFASLNVGMLTGDAAADVAENRVRLAAALGRDPAGIVFARQVHGIEVVTDRGEAPAQWLAPGPAPREADGLATADRGRTPLVQIADCLPIALAGPGGVAMIHGGWRGLAAGIVDRGVAAVEASAAAIGPGIGACCFEVGDEVRERFDDLGPGVAAGRMLDLVEVARRLLARAGVKEVEVAGLCTRCERERFFSHRRDGGRTGRQAGLVWIDADG